MVINDSDPFILGTPSEQAEALAARAKALRLHANITQVQMAKRSGMSANAYRIFERTGKTSLTAYLAVVAALRRSRELADHLSPAPAPADEPARRRARAKSGATA